MNKLEEIISHRRVQVARDRKANDCSAVAREARQTRDQKSPHALRRALENKDRVNLIGEFKRASPSLGSINREAKPAETAATYARAGVCAISVLTEPDFFHGSLDDLREVRRSTDLPILRKDFVIDEYQIDEAAAAGADAVLLIVAALGRNELTKFREQAETQLGMDALVEVHTREEMARALEGGAQLIGVNNRDLHSFKTSIETSVELASLAPSGVTLVSESGISDASQIARLLQCGYRGFLIGESLMRASDPAALIRSFQTMDPKELRHV